MPPVCNVGISPGQKWWWTVLEIGNSCSQWEGSACTQRALIFFLLSFGLGGRTFFIYVLFPSSPQCVPNMFPICSPRVFSIAPRFNPMCFAQSPPLLTYIGGPKGEALDFCLESSILGSLHSFNSFWTWANQIGSLQKKEKVGLMRHPQLINMKQNK